MIPSDPSPIRSPFARPARAPRLLAGRGAPGGRPAASEAPRLAESAAARTAPAAVRRVFIVEDHPAVREGYALLFRLAPDLDVAGMAVSAEEALRVVSEAAPDLVLVDMALPGMSGLDLIAELRARDAALRMLVVSGQARGVYEERARAHGALGFVSKNDGPEALMAAVRGALDGPPPA